MITELIYALTLSVNSIGIHPNTLSASIVRDQRLRTSKRSTALRIPDERIPSTFPLDNVVWNRKPRTSSNTTRPVRSLGSEVAGVNRASTCR